MLKESDAKPRAKTRAHSNASNASANPKESSTSSTDKPDSANFEENFVQNLELAPYVVGEFLGCDVVMDDDVAMINAQGTADSPTNSHLHSL